MKGVINKTLKSKKAEGFVDSGVKILIAIVIGAVVLGGTYTLTKDTVLASAKEKVEELFDYQGNTIEEIEAEAEPEPTLFSFTIPQGRFDAEEGMTWSEWVKSDYNTTSLSVAWGNYIGRDDGNYSGIKLYYNQNGKTIYVSPNELIDTSKHYQVEIDLPMDWF